MNDTSDLKYFLISLCMHLVLVLFLAVKVVFFPGERPEFLRAVRVDFVALPDKDVQLAPPGEEKPQPAPTPAPEKQAPVQPEPAKTPSKTTEKKTSPKSKTSEPTKADKLKDQQSSALQRLEALNRLKKKKSEAAEGTTIKGNRLNQGHALTGVEKIEYNRYLADLDIHIKRFWHLPEWLVDKPYKTSIWIRFDEKGVLLEKKILRPSGQPDYDKEAIQAIVDSAPFPAPPENLISYFKDNGIELRFPD